MASHPYISGPGNITQMVNLLRKNFPATVTSETVKKFGLASNNESYVINALQFIGAIDEDGKRTTKGHDTFVLSDADFPKAFESLVRDAYKDLFELRGEDAWSLQQAELTSYFRTADKTSDVIGGRQATVFRVFRALAGREQLVEKPANGATAKAKPSKSKVAPAKKTKAVEAEVAPPAGSQSKPEGRRDMAMTVRIEINLPANGSQETYDAIFKSIRANLIDE